MLDTVARRVTGPPLDSVARRAADAGIHPTAITGAGWVVAIACRLAILGGA